MPALPSARAAATTGLVGVLLWSLTGCGAISRFFEPPTRDVILVVIDTTRADHLSSYGHVRPTTPHIDGLAEEGTLFEQAYSAASWTLPAFGTLFTGMYPSAHQAGRNPKGNASKFGTLRSDVPTLAGLFKTKNYRTGAFVNNSFLAKKFKLHRDFDVYDYVMAHNGAHRSADDTVDAALDWLNASEIPALMVVHLMEPHLVYRPPMHTRWRFRKRNERPGFPLPFTNKLGEYRRGKRKLTAKQKDYVRRVYDEEILAADHAVGTLIAGLKEQGIADTTLLIITSDHGEEFWDHGGYEHGHTLHGELTRIPLVIAGPGVPAMRVKTPVQHTDLFVGLINRVEAALPPGLPGQDLFQLVADEQDDGPKERAILTEGQLYNDPKAALTLGTDRLIIDLRTQKRTLWKVDAVGTHDRRAKDSGHQHTQKLFDLLVKMRGSSTEGKPRDNNPHLTEAEIAPLKALGYIAE